MKSSAILALGFILVGSAAALIPTTTFPDEPEPKAYRVAPIRRPPGHEERRRAAAAQAEEIESGRWAPALEEEAAIKPTPRRPVLLSSFAGMNFNDTPGFVPPDTHAATGPDHIVETVNTTVAYFDRTTGAMVFGPQDLGGVTGFFGSVGATTNLTDPVVAYDLIDGRFFIGVIDFGASGTTARLLYAVSDTSNPLDGFTEMHSIDVDEPALACGGTALADFPRVGWNAEIHVFTFNMFNFVSDCFDHVSIITIDKSTALDVDAGTLTFSHSDFDNSHFTSTPAVMHGSVSGDPMWFVAEADFGNNNGQNELRVIKMTNVLNATPTFTETDIAVDTYGSPPSASQKGTRGRIDAGDTRILHVEWRDDRLVAAHTVGVSGVARARWYEFDTSDTTPALTQQGTINQGSGVHTYYPSIAIAPNGDLGMTFMQSSSKKFMSMYVTGRLRADPLGTMQTPVLAKAGVATYRAFDCFNFTTGKFIPNTPCRAGDYSGITVAPDTNDTFCAANEYAISKSSAPDANWGTWITCFRIGVHDLAVTAISAPATVTGTGQVTRTVKVTIQNRSDHSHTLTLADLGDGTTTGLVRLTVDAIDDGSESCTNPAGVAFDNAVNAALFPGGSKILKSKAKLTVNFLVTYDCAAPVSKITSATGDYSHTATVHHDVLDGNPDAHAADDICPHNSFFDPNPPTKGTKDSGCGAKISKTTFGNPVVTNVIAP